MAPKMISMSSSDRPLVSGKKKAQVAAIIHMQAKKKNCSLVDFHDNLVRGAYDSSMLEGLNHVGSESGDDQVEKPIKSAMSTH
jgi:hypothetical protein